MNKQNKKSFAAGGFHSENSGNLMRALMVCLAVLANTAQAASNYWQDISGNYSGNYTNPAHWSLGRAPTNSDSAFFTNNQSAAYTISFSASHSNGSVQITTDKIIFDLKGYKWRAFPRPSDGLWEHRIAANAGETATVTFSSSAAPAVTNGNTLDFTDVAYLYFGTWGNPDSATINIDDSLGYPVKLLTPTIVYSDVRFTISGTNSELRTQAGGGQDIRLRTGTGRVLNGALLYTVTAPMLGFMSGTPPVTTLTVSNASLDSAGASIGFYSSGKLELLSNSVWYATRGAQVTVGYERSAGSEAWNGDLLVDNSTVYANAMVIGRGAGDIDANGRAVIQNGALVILSNGYLTVAAENVYGGNTNTLVLSNATIRLGPAGNGAITNRAIMRAAGTIMGLGSGNFLLRNEKWLYVAGTSSLGTLTMNQGDLELTAPSENYFEFSDTGLDQITASNGFANVLGTNIFALASGAPAPRPQYGLLNYDFIVATNITYSPAADNLTALLGTYGLSNGVDFTYGVVDLGGGLQALRLKFLPSRGTVITAR